jgi:hypothetical protein
MCEEKHGTTKCYTEEIWLYCTWYTIKYERNMMLILFWIFWIYTRIIPRILAVQVWAIHPAAFAVFEKIYCALATIQNYNLLFICTDHPCIRVLYKHIQSTYTVLFNIISIPTATGVNNKDIKVWCLTARYN